MAASLNFFYALVVIGAFLMPVASACRDQIADSAVRADASVVSASIMSDDYTTYRRARGDASRVG